MSVTFKDQYDLPTTVQQHECDCNTPCIELKVNKSQMSNPRIVLDREQAAVVGRTLLAFAGTGKVPKYTRD